VFALLVFITRGLTTAVFLHFGWNAMLELLNLPISGINASTNWHFVTLRAKGEGILTGGSFGPEGSIVLTVLLAILLAACLYTFPRSLSAMVTLISTNARRADTEMDTIISDDSDMNNPQSS